MNTSFTPRTTLERETSLDQIKKIKKKLNCNFSNFIFYFITVLALFTPYTIIPPLLFSSIKTHIKKYSRPILS